MAKRRGPVRCELVENRVMVWNSDDARLVFAMGYYGKPVGMPKPRIDEIDVPLVLDLIEGLYLLEEGAVTITRSRRRITVQQMMDMCRDEYHGFDKKYVVYRRFRDLGYVVSSGIKYGCDFAVYERGPGIDHAPYMVHVYAKSDAITSTGIVLAGRLASAVRKQFILAIPGRGRNVDFVALDWWKA